MFLSNRHHFCILDLIAIYVKSGRLKEARELFHELREKSLSGDVHIDGLIGFTASMLGELEIAREYYLKAIKNRDGDLIFHPRYPFMKEFVLSADFAKQLRVEMKFPE